MRLFAEALIIRQDDTGVAFEKHPHAWLEALFRHTWPDGEDSASGGNSLPLFGD
jgi:hypothetical protein